jgi:hypothetical protein
MAKTIKNQFSNMYGEGKNLNIGKNRSVKELLNNIPNIEPNANANANENKGANKIKGDNENENMKSPFRLETKLETNTNTSSSSSPFKRIYLIIILLLFMIIGIIFYYKDIILQFISNLTNKNEEDTTDTATVDTSTNDKIDNTVSKIDNTTAKVNDTSAKVDVNSSKIDNTSTKIDDTSAKIDALTAKINTMSDKECPASASAPAPAVNSLNNKIDKISTYSKNVTENGYCYIGYDNGQRDCVDVYAGDVCMSGEIFPTLDICINPKLRA